MLRFCLVTMFALAAVAPALPARADTGPVIVIPSRPGIPIVINGRDASYALVEGDWGLARPGHGVVTVIGGMPVAPNRVYSRRNSYHPRYGAAPERGRHEIDPPLDRQLPEQAESFSRGWGTPPPMHPMTHYPPPGDQPTSGQSLPFNVGGDVVPPTITDPQTFYQPPVVVVPRRR